MPLDMERLRRAIATLEMKRLGLPTPDEQEATRIARERQAAIDSSQLETAGLQRQQMRQNMELLPELTMLRAETARAQAEKAKALAERDPQPTGDAYLASLTPEQLAEYVRRKKMVADATRTPDKPAGLSPAIESNIINRLTTQWDKANSTIGELKRQRDLMHSGLEAARKGDMAAGSQAVLVTFQKILDPTSVVRESEYARSAAGQALAARIQGAFERIRVGGAGVPVSELEKFAALADQFVQNATADSNVATIRGRIAATADRYKIPHDVVFGVEPPAQPAPVVLGQTPGEQPAPETWIEVAPGIRKKVRK